ncbi:seryl-tRNA synthetase [Paenibacillus turicensis]|uniref:Serine--tRNA ligase n=1 Tax=Paenibacillus turicensis TaxID=160487 RepID=A0ABS4FTN8_9BACL|nr:serine--tRNA ligase [Paenibacillus turicensis]MBP1905946.1 seryl-tRNA synthetase [Paenibacillus turicensis]
MLDIKWIEAHAEEVQHSANAKGIMLSVKELIKTNQHRIAHLQQLEQLRATRNRLTNEIHQAIQGGDNHQAEQLKHTMKQNKQALEHAQVRWQEANQQYEALMLLVPNIISVDSPNGESDKDNVELRHYLEPTAFDFPARDHVELGEIHQMIDIQSGTKTSGSRQYYLTGMGFRLHRAVQQLAIDLLMNKGFEFMEVPLMVKTEAMVNTGFFPLGQDQSYHLEGEDYWLVGTSEVPLISYFSGKKLDVTQPIKVAAVSTCFRSEVGSAGRDTSGLYRVHQFNKVEQVVICEDDITLSQQLHEEITENAEELLQLLELPYRVMAVCSGDMSQKTYKQYDIETWMPSRQAYGETHSSSNLLQFQARRANIAYLDTDGKPKYCHTLNNTAVATPRILIPLLENHQQQDGSIYIPKALRPYLQGLEYIK